MMAPKDQWLLFPLSGYALDVGVWLSALQDARARTMRVLDKVEPHWIDFIPEGEGESIGTILYHLAAIEASWLYEDILQLPLPPDIEPLFPHDVRDEAGNLTSVSESLQRHLNRLRNVREDFLKQFSTMTVDDFWRPLSLPEYDLAPVYAIHHLMQHEAEHRSQIDAIRRKAARVLGSRLPEETL